MLKIYYGDETLDKQNFIFEQIDPARKTIVIVPDQFSLQMERDVLEFFRGRGKAALLDVMITDFSALGHKVVKEIGGRPPELIDKYGRHMLLSVIIERLAGELGIYRKMSGRNSFVSMTNQLISEMKRYGTSPDELESLINESPVADTENQDVAEDSAGRSKIGNSYLAYKLADIARIYEAYEEAIADKYLDSEDYIRFYGELILRSELVKDAEIWVYGFDTFTPLNILVMEKLLQRARSVNVVMTCEFDRQYVEDARVLLAGGGEGIFDLTGYVIEELKQMAESIGEESQLFAIKDYREQSAGDKTGSAKSVRRPQVTLAETSNPYAEAERAAAYIMQLVRDEGYKFGDIVLICNDMDVRGRILTRTLQRWGIPAFADLKRHVLHQPVVRFLMSLLGIIGKGFDTDTIMNMVKSGLLGWRREDEELLENYTSEFRIRGTGWKKPFKRTGDHYSEKDLKRVNELRKQIVSIVAKARDDIGRRNSAGDKITGLYEYLESDFSIRDNIGKLIERQQELGLAEGAAETGQSWNVICSLFSQIVRVIGDEKISNDTLRALMAAGLEEAEIGLVPVSSDCVIIGTMQRTRISGTRVLMVTSACEGVLPMDAGSPGLLTDRELAALEELQVSISKREEVSRQEEQLAMYRNLSMPSEKLYMSLGRADADGKTVQPSMVYNSLKSLCQERLAGDDSGAGERDGAGEPGGADHTGGAGGFAILGDLDSEEPLAMMNSRRGALTYMAGAMRAFMEDGHMDQEWLAAMDWYGDNAPEDLSRINAGINFSNRLEALGSDMADALYVGDRDRLYVSASRLERYSDCPFRHFVDHGLRAEEQRKFEIGGREIGDIYHQCLMEFSRRLTPENGPVYGARSEWMTISREDCEKSIREILKGEADAYKEGVFADEGEGRFRLERIAGICSDVAWALVGQVRKSRIREMHFEEPFGYEGSRLPAIEVELPGGRKASLRGKIDRMDILDVERNVPGASEKLQHYDAVSIVDYKSGGNQIDLDQFRSGYRLQLMVYMNAASGQSPEADGQEASGLEGDGGFADEGVKPAGVFYFKIREFMEEAERLDKVADKESIAERIKSAYRMEGIVIDDENLYRSMDGEFWKAASEGAACQSDTIPVKHLKTDNAYKKGPHGELMTREDFQELCQATNRQVERICREIYEGCIDIAPKRERTKDMDGKRRNSCTFCQYKSICMFDTSFDGCRFTSV